MTKLPVCVLGSNGMLGRAVVSTFARAAWPVTGITRRQFEAGQSNIGALQRYIEVEGQYVINCIGAGPGGDSENLILVNAVFPRVLAAFSANVGARLIHISSNGVFSGSRGNYVESDIPDATDPYGISKFLGESGGCMVLRTSLIGHADKSRQLLGWLVSQKSDCANGFTNHVWNGVSTLVLARGLRRIVTEERYTTGVLHIHSTESVTKYELLCTIKDCFGLRVGILPAVATRDTDLTLNSFYSLSSEIVDMSLFDQIRELAAASSSANCA